jgi:hypothetical protein
MPFASVTGLMCHGATPTSTDLRHRAAAGAIALLPPAVSGYGNVHRREDPFGSSRSGEILPENLLTVSFRSLDG